MNLVKDFENSENPYFGADVEEEDTSTMDRGDTFEEGVDEDDDDLGTDTIIPEKEGEDEGAGEEAGEGAEDDPEGEEAEGAAAAAGEADSDEADPETDTAAADKAQSEDKGDIQKRSASIPRTRFDEVNNKLQRAKDRITELERVSEAGGQTKVEKQATAEELDFEKEILAEQDEIHKLVLDGDTEGASRKQYSLNQRMMSKATEQAREYAREEVSFSSQRQAYESTLSDLEARFPFINPDVADAYDDSMVTRIRSISRSLISDEGYSQADALQEATETVAARYHPELLTPAPAAAKPKASVDVPAKQAARTQADVEKKVGAATRQPPKPSGVSTASERDSLPSINDMSEDEFSALSQKEIARLRGDII